MTKQILKIVAKEVGWFLFAFFLTLLIEIFIYVIIFLIINLFFSENYQEYLNNNFPQNSLLTISLAQNIAFLICALWRRRLESSIIDKWRQNRRDFSVIKKISLGCITAFILIIAVYSQELILYQFFDGVELSKNSWDELQNSQLSERMILFFLGAFLAPITEELYFREAMLGSIYRSGFPNFAIFFSCAVFGIIHLNFMHIFAYLIYGIGFSLLYLKTKSLVPTIAAHILINSILLSIFLFT